MSDKRNYCNQRKDDLQRKLSTAEITILEEHSPKRPDFWDVFPDDPTPGRPNYVLLRRKTYDLLEASGREPIPDVHRETWVEANLDLREVLLDLTPGDALGVDTYLVPGDIRAEQERLVPALEKAHDFLKLYAEVLKHPPPEDLLEIEQILRFRYNELQRIHSQPSPPGP